MIPKFVNVGPQYDTNFGIGALALGAGFLAAAQAVEHYEISRYGTLKTWADKLGLKDAIKLLDETLSEEKKTDETLKVLGQIGVKVIARVMGLLLLFVATQFVVDGIRATGVLAGK